MLTKLRSKILIWMGLLLLALGCGSPKQTTSKLDSQPDDGLMRVLKVPLPRNSTTFTFSDNFRNEIPLIISSNTTPAGDTGYWVFCENAADEENLVKSLGLSYEKFTKAGALIPTATKFNPSLTKRDEEQQKYCEGAERNDRVCTLYKLAPDINSPLICPGSLPAISPKFELRISNLDTTNSYAEYLSDTGKLKAIDLGCVGAKQALMGPAGNDLVREVKITLAQKPSPVSDLNCVGGTSLKPMDFTGFCEEARKTDWNEDLLTLNALIVRLDLPSEDTCSALSGKIGKAISELEEGVLDLSGAGITSLKIFRYLPSISNIKTLKLNDNFDLGATDTATQGVLDDLRPMIKLKSLLLGGTQVSNLLGLKGLQFLSENSIDIFWPQVRPAACSPQSLSVGLRKPCTALQKPISVGLASGQSSVPVSFADDTIVTLKASHSLAVDAGADFYRYVVKSTSCQGVQLSGNKLKLTSVPTNGCTVEVTASAAQLVTGTGTIEYQYVPTCGNYRVGSSWDEEKEEYKGKFECVRVGEGAQPKLLSGTCHKATHDLDVTTASCIVARCENGIQIGSTYPVYSKPSLALAGEYTAKCVLKEGVTQGEYVPGSGSCRDSRNEFVEALKECRVARCANGVAIGSKGPEVTTADGRGKYFEVCKNYTMSEDAIDTRMEFLPGSGQCQSGYNFDEKTLACVADCNTGLPIPASYFADYAVVPTQTIPSTFAGTVDVKIDDKISSWTINTLRTLEVYNDGSVAIVDNSSAGEWVTSSYWYSNNAVNIRNALAGKITSKIYSASMAEVNSGVNTNRRNKRFVKTYNNLNCLTKVYKSSRQRGYHYRNPGDRRIVNDYWNDNELRLVMSKVEITEIYCPGDPDDRWDKWDDGLLWDGNDWVPASTWLEELGISKVDLKEMCGRPW